MAIGQEMVVTDRRGIRVIPVEEIDPHETALDGMTLEQKIDALLRQAEDELKNKFPQQSGKEIL